MKKILFVLFCAFFLLITPNLVYAVSCDECGGLEEPALSECVQSCSDDTDESDTTADNTSGSGATTNLENPLGGITDPRDIIGNVISAILGIVGSLALLMFIYGGFLWVTSAGNDEKISKGKDIVIWASLGLALIFASYALLNFILGAITGSTGNKATGNTTSVDPGGTTSVDPGDTSEED